MKKSLLKLLIYTLVVILLVMLNLYKLKDNKLTIKEKDNNVVESKENEKLDNIEIKLNGIEELKIVKNGVYEELGATATIDGVDATDKIEIDSKVDTSKPGDYEITYKVNGKKIIRKVNVFEVEDKDTDGISVLMYHYFYDNTAGETGKTSNYMAKTIFEEQLKYLSENDYYFPTMKELNLYLDGKLELPSKSVILTFDDGEESNYRIAYPLAVQYKVPLNWFVVTSWTDIHEPYQQELKNTGYINYLSHTDSLHHGGCGEQHGGALLCVNYQEGVNDLKTSVEKLGNSDAMAYPCGDSNDNAKQIVRDAGISLAFTVEYGKVQRGQDKLSLPRVRMNDGISLSSFIGSL